MPFSRFGKMSSEKRERLLTIAAQEFAAHGFEATSFNRILEEAHIGKSSAYYYFEDKADLFCAVVEYCVDRLQLSASGVDVTTLTAETFWGRLTELHSQPLLRAQQQPWLFAAARAVNRLPPEMLEREPLASLAQRLMAGMGTMIKRGQELGLIRSDLPDELLFAWFKALDEASDDWLLAHLDQLDQAAIVHVSQQTMAALQRALAPVD
jgi:AcrR family transcriptional regulator